MVMSVLPEGGRVHECVEEDLMGMPSYDTYH